MLTGGPQGRWTHSLPPFKGGSVAPTFTKIQDRLLASDTRLECYLYLRVLDQMRAGPSFLNSNAALSPRMTGTSWQIICPRRSLACNTVCPQRVHGDCVRLEFGACEERNTALYTVKVPGLPQENGLLTATNLTTTRALEGLVYSKEHCQPYSKSPWELMGSV